MSPSVRDRYKKGYFEIEKALPSLNIFCQWLKVSMKNSNRDAERIKKILEE